MSKAIRIVDLFKGRSRDGLPITLALTLAIVSAFCLMLMTTIPVEARTTSTQDATDIFTPPTNSAGNVPKFYGKNGQTIAPNDTKEDSNNPPRMDLMKSLPSLSADQRKQIDAIERDNRLQQQSISNDLQSAEEEQKLRKGMLSGSITETETSTSPFRQIDNVDLQKQIDSLKQNLTASKLQVLQSTYLVLSRDQHKQIEQMRKGELMLAPSPAKLPDQPLQPKPSPAPIVKQAVQRFAKQAIWTLIQHL